MDGGAWQATVHGVARVGHNLVTKPPPHIVKVKVLIAQWCPALCDPRDCSPPGSSVCGIFQGGILEQVAISPRNLYLF